MAAQNISSAFSKCIAAKELSSGTPKISTSISFPIPVFPFLAYTELSFISPILAMLKKSFIWAGGWKYPLTCPDRLLSDDQLRLYQTLDILDISFMVQPYFPGTLRQISHGHYPKNIVLKDRKGQFYYIIIPEEKQIDLKKLKPLLKAHRNFSFATSTELYNLVKCPPGAVTPFGLLFCQDKSITVIIEKSLNNLEKINFHPLIESEAMLLSFAEVERFVSFCEFEMKVMHLPYF